MSTISGLTTVPARVGFEERELRGQIKALGEIWVPDRRCWRIDETHIAELGLQERIAAD